MHKKDLAHFERISHILIEEGFGDFFVKTGLIDSLSVIEKIELFFEKKHPLAQRIKSAAQKCGPSFVHFVKYLSTRTDVIEPKLCYELADIEVVKIKPSTDVELPKITLNKKKYDQVRDSALHFDGFSYCCDIAPAKTKKASPYQIHFLEKKIMQTYERDLELLHFFATIIDSQCNFSFNAKRVIHEYMHVVHQRFHLKRHMRYAQKIKGALSNTKAMLPEYVISKSTDTHLLVKPMPGISANQIPKAIMAYHEHSDELMANLTTVLFSPMFTHGFLIQELEPDNIMLQSKGNVGLNHIPGIEELTRTDVAAVTTIFGGLLTKDTTQVLEGFMVNPASTQFTQLHAKIDKIITAYTHLQSKHIEQIFEIVNEKHKIQPFFFEIVQLMHICEEIQFHFQIKRTILIALQPHIEMSFKMLIGNQIANNAKLNKAQKLLVSEETLKTELANLHVRSNSRNVYTHMTFAGYLILVLLTFSIILQLLKDSVALIQIFVVLVACLILTRASKHHIIRHSHWEKEK